MIRIVYQVHPTAVHRRLDGRRPKSGDHMDVGKAHGSIDVNYPVDGRQAAQFQQGLEFSHAAGIACGQG